MKRLLLATTAIAVLTGTPALAQECRERLDSLEQVVGTADTYTTVLRSGMHDEIGALWDVASDLERQGEDEACLQIADSLESMITKAQTPGIVDPDAWELEQVARLEEATPVTDDTGRMRIQDIIGMSVYTPRNEYLGELDDVVLHGSGIGYGVIARGGFLGIGSDEVPVPWDRFSVTRDHETLVLDIDPAQLDGAPTYAAVDMESDGDGAAIDFEAIRDDVDSFFSDLTN